MSSSIEENKALVRRFFAAIESADFPVFDEIVAENYDDHLAGQGPGRGTLKKYFAGLHAAFADLKLPISAMVAEGDKVAVLNSVQGAHKGDFIGLPPPVARLTPWHFSSTESGMGNLRSIGKSRTTRL